jgi:hypothetical protein
MTQGDAETDLRTYFMLRYVGFTGFKLMARELL